MMTVEPETVFTIWGTALLIVFLLGCIVGYYSRTPTDFH